MSSATQRVILVSGVLAPLVLLLALPAAAQTTSSQTRPPQPPPAPKAAAPQASAPKPAGTQPPGPKTQAPKAPAARKPPPPQTSPVWKGRGFVVLSGGAQLAAPGYASTVTFTVHAEDATLNARSKIQIGPVFGARVGMRAWKNLAVGAAVGVTSTSQEVDVTGRLPHPFMFNQFRDVQGTASGLGRLETMYALEASWFVALRRRVDMFVFAGPAYFSVRQDMATRIRFTESYPFDSASFTGVDSANVSGSAVGVTAGADVAYLVSKRLGVGGQLRYSYASTTLRPAGQAATVGLGGLQLSVGGRVLF